MLYFYLAAAMLIVGSSVIVGKTIGPKGTALLQIIGHIPMGTSTIIERSGSYGLQIFY